MLPSGVSTLIIAVGALFLFFAVVMTLSNRYNLNNIKDKTVGHGQHGTARWATKKEIRRIYTHINYEPEKWRTDPKSRPKEQGIVVGCKNRRLTIFTNFLRRVWYRLRKLRNRFRRKKNKKYIPQPIQKGTTTAMVDTGDVHALMIGAAGVGKTAFWLYPCIEYACATGMSFLSTDTKGDVVRNYGEIASKYYGYNISVIDLRNPTRSNDNNLLHLVNKYTDMFKAEPTKLVYKAKAEKYAKIIAKTIIMSGGDSASYGQNAYFYDSAEGLLTATILLVAEFCKPNERHIVSVYKIIQELLAPSNKKGKNQFQQVMELLPENHKAKWFAGAALTTAEDTMASVMSTALSRLNALFFKWGISFEAPFSIAEHGNREVHYAKKKDLTDAILKKYRPDLLTAAKDKSDDKTSGGNLKATRANKDVPLEQASHPAENKEVKQSASKKKSDKKDDSKSGNGNKRVMEQQITQKPMQPRAYRNGGERK